MWTLISLNCLLPNSMPFILWLESCPRLFYLLLCSSQHLLYPPQLHLKLYISPSTAHLAFSYQAPFTQSRKCLIPIVFKFLPWLYICENHSRSNIYHLLHELFQSYCYISLYKIHRFLYLSYTWQSDFFPLTYRYYQVTYLLKSSSDSQRLMG